MRSKHKKAGKGVELVPGHVSCLFNLVYYPVDWNEIFFYTENLNSALHKNSGGLIIIGFKFTAHLWICTYKLIINLKFIKVIYLRN